MAIGDFTYYIGIIGQLTTCIFRLITSISDIIQQKIKIEYYDNFKSWDSLVKHNNKGLSIKTFESLEFQNVYFKYPNTEEYILKNVSFIIKKMRK